MPAVTDAARAPRQSPSPGRCGNDQRRDGRVDGRVSVHAGEGIEGDEGSRKRKIESGNGYSRSAREEIQKWAHQSMAGVLGAKSSRRQRPAHYLNPSMLLLAENSHASVAGIHPRVTFGLCLLTLK